MNINQYIGMRYDRDVYDCADFVIQVQREMFGRDIHLPASRPRISSGGQRHIKSLSETYVRPTSSPVDGDIVLMRQCGKKRATHIGVYFFIAHEGWVLHCSEDTGYSTAQQVRTLPDTSVEIEGYYTWHQI
ncbi:NlpC/P60 family protein [Xanthomonas oryzae]|uniref:NlpC/P60 family protein n=1 Tax=Xanthomonas oryzae TaxID=347 RepID=UPI0009EC771B|nr:NlpC/P60 family protein [Xanthomonas oryzae]